jgi:hypothetical protein
VLGVSSGGIEFFAQFSFSIVGSVTRSDFFRGGSKMDLEFKKPLDLSVLIP